MISVMLSLWAAACIAFAFFVRVGSTAPAEEIEAEIALLIATVAIVGVGIIEAVKKSGKGEQRE
jgi:cytosine/uracil/thiamine/allantoin permease